MWGTAMRSSVECQLATNRVQTRIVVSAQGPMLACDETSRAKSTMDSAPPEPRRVGARGISRSLRLVSLSKDPAELDSRRLGACGATLRFRLAGGAWAASASQRLVPVVGAQRLKFPPFSDDLRLLSLRRRRLRSEELEPCECELKLFRLSAAVATVSVSLGSGLPRWDR